MNKLLLASVVAASAIFGQTAESAGSPPAGIDPAVAAVLQKEGIRVKEGNKVIAELWFAASPPSAPKTAEDNVTLTNIPFGALMGVVRFPERGSDRRGQQIKPGVYTMRLGFFPQNGDHQGVAPQRDFFLLVSAADDKDPKANLAFEPLTKLSMKASGTPHPLVFSAWKAESGFKPGLAQEGEHDWVLQTKVGETPVALIVIGKVDH